MIFQVDNLVVKPTPSASALSLESLGDCSDSSTVEEQWEVRACSCRNWFCPDCAERMGYSLRRKLAEALKDWDSILMITLTVDQMLFSGPCEAYEWVRSHFGIGRLVRDMKRLGLVGSGRYFSVIEFQENGWPHWHILIESRFILHSEIERLWGRLRPPGIAREPGRPLFGICRFSARSFKSPEHAANYSTKYLVKEPKHGWPNWVLDFEGRVARYSRSRNFWPSDTRRSSSKPDVVGVAHSVGCFCQVCREGINSETGKPRRQLRTIRERTARCGQGSILMRYRRKLLPDGGYERSRECVGFSPRSVRFLADRFHVDGDGFDGRKFTIERRWLRVVAEEFFPSPYSRVTSKRELFDYYLF